MFRQTTLIFISIILFFSVFQFSVVEGQFSSIYQFPTNPLSNLLNNHLGNSLPSVSNAYYRAMKRINPSFFASAGPGNTGTIFM